MSGPDKKGIVSESSRAEIAHALEMPGWFKALFTGIPDLAFICDRKGNILYVNDAFERITGNKADDFICHPFHRLFDEDNLKAAEACHKKSMAGERTTCELYFKDTGKLCEFKNAPLRDESGRITGVVGIAREIPRSRREDELRERDRHMLADLVQERTRELIEINEELLKEVSLREEAERGLAALEQGFTGLIEALPEAVIVADADSRAILHANTRASRLAGIPLEEMAGMKFTALGIDAHFHSSSARSSRKTFVRNRVTGRTATVRATSTEVDAGGRKILNLVLRDITPPGPSTVGARMLKALEQSQGAVAIADVNGVIEFANPVFGRLAGCAAAEAAGKNIRRFFNARNEKEFDDFLMTVLAGGMWRGVFKAPGKDGGVRDCDVLVMPLKAEGGPVTHMLCIHEAR
ncbi:MAG: PAS domain S-box protein [Thermodesulfobacteriota bacterium]